MKRITVMFTAVALSAFTLSSHGLITEYANNYGTVDIDPIDGLNGGTGWTGAWVNAKGNNGHRFEFDTSLNLMYGGAGYSNTGNETDADDGAFDRTNNSPFYTREFASTSAPSIWMSALIRGERGDGRSQPRVGLVGDLGDFEAGFTDDAPGSDVAGSENRGFLFVDGSAGDVTDTSIIYDTGVHLVLAQLLLNGAGADTVNVWIDPDLSTVGTLGVAGLGTPELTGMAEIGSQVSAVQILGEQTDADIDAIRISDSVNGLLEVLSGEVVPVQEPAAPAVPEPASIALLGLGGLALLRRRVQR